MARRSPGGSLITSRPAGPGTPAAPAPALTGLGTVFSTWWPLAASWMLMGLELPLVAAVMARLPLAERSLAAYGGVVFPVSLFIEGPIIMLLAASTALCRDRHAYALIRSMMMRASFALTLVHVAVAFTPLFDVVAGPILHAPEEIREPARIGLRIMTPWTWSIAYRRFQQGVLIRTGRARYVGAGTVVRLVANALVLGTGFVSGTIPGYIIGPAAVASGVILEAVFAGIWVRPALRDLIRKAPPAIEPLTRRRFLAFYVPLALTPLITMAGQPVVAGALGRMPGPVESLAALPVVHGLTFFLRSLGFAYNEVVVALLDRPGARQALTRFALLLAAALTAVMVVLSATPLGLFYFGRVSGLPGDLAALAAGALWLAAPLPGLAVALHFNQGILVHRGTTVAVTEAVVLNIVALAGVLAAGAAWGGAPGLHVAVAANTAANFVQAAWLAWRARVRVHPATAFP